LEKNAIISHRLRGFDKVDASLNGIRNALTKSIPAFEVDTRFTADGEIVLHHDPFIIDNVGGRQYICEMTYDELLEKSKQKILNYLPAKLVELLREMQTNNAYGIKAYIDIKEFGREKEIIRLFDSFSLKENLVVVSWLPEVLFAVHELDETIPLCFSHYPLVHGKYVKNTLLKWRFAKQQKIKIHEAHSVHYVTDGYNKTDLQACRNENKPGDDYEHLVTAPLKGKLLDVLKKSRGMVCCEMRFTGEKLIEVYHHHKIQVMVYSVKTAEQLERFRGKIKVDYVLSDNSAFCV